MKRLSVKLGADSVRNPQCGDGIKLAILVIHGPSHRNNVVSREETPAEVADEVVLVSEVSTRWLTG